MKLKCKKCGNEWDYQGKAPFWATCPRCLRKVKKEQIKPLVVGWGGNS